jgi:hypothetical protein
MGLSPYVIRVKTLNRSGQQSSTCGRMEQDSMHVESARRLQFVSDKPLNIEGGTHVHYITVGASRLALPKSKGAKK